VTVELEIRRHDWQSLSSAYGNSSLLPDAVRALRTAESRADAEAALDRVEQVLPLGEGPAEVSAAAASVLVHSLWGCGEHSLDLVLGVLADLAAGFSEGDPLDHAQAVLRRDVLQEISRGFVSYVEIMESTNADNARTACIDLITACGGADPGLRERGIHFLEAVSKDERFVRHREVIDASIAELRAG
jgi:hypothetical protein